MRDDRDGKVDPGLVRAAVHANTFKPMAPWVRSTGFRGNGLRYRALHDCPEARLGEDFLVNSRLRRNDPETEASILDYYTDASMVMLSMAGEVENPGWREISLPRSAPLRMELGEALSWRRSVRFYTGDPMLPEHLGTLVRSAAGVTASADIDLNQGGQATLAFRTAPSAGGLYPVTLQLAILHVTGIERGVYRYDPLDDKLWQTGGDEDARRVVVAIDVPDEAISVDRANVVALLVGQPWRVMRKYGSRGMRYLFLEAGAMAQNLNLAVAALGYGGVDCGCIYDDEAHEALHLDGVHAALVHTVVVGSAG